MATRIIMNVATTTGEPGHSAYVDVSETFDDCIEKLIPTRQPSSSLEIRANNIYNKADGSGRVSVPMQTIAWMEEDPSDD